MPPRRRLAELRRRPDFHSGVRTTVKKPLSYLGWRRIHHRIAAAIVDVDVAVIPLYLCYVDVTKHPGNATTQHDPRPPPACSNPASTARTPPEKLRLPNGVGNFSAFPSTNRWRMSLPPLPPHVALGCTSTVGRAVGWNLPVFILEPGKKHDVSSPPQTLSQRISRAEPDRIR